MPHASLSALDSALDEKAPLSVRSYEYGFATTPPAEPRATRGGMRRGMAVVVPVLGLAAVLFGTVELVRASGLVPRPYVAGAKPPTPRDRVQAAPKGPRDVLATKLWADYQSNDKTANAHYKGEVLDVTGVVAGLDSDLIGSVIVKLESPNPYTPTRAYLADTSAPPVRGTEATLRCQGAGMMMGSPVLRDCVLR